MFFIDYRGQGASVSAIRPEFLLSPQDYRRWVLVRDRERQRVEKGDADSPPPDSAKKPEADVSKAKSTFLIEDELFESVSKRAWTDLLLQLFKVSKFQLLCT